MLSSQEAQNSPPHLCHKQKNYLQLEIRRWTLNLQRPTLPILGHQWTKSRSQEVYKRSKYTCFLILFKTARAWRSLFLHRGGDPQVVEVTDLGGIKKKTSFTCNLTTPPSRGALSEDYLMVVKQVTKNMVGIHGRVLAFNALYSLSAFSAVAFSLHF